MTATINGINYASFFQFMPAFGTIRIDIKQGRNVICDKTVDFDLSLSQLEIEAFKLLYSNLVGTTSKTDELSLF